VSGAPGGEADDACAQAGITPDLMCVSKGLTGGFLPLAATLVREPIYQTFLDARRDRGFLHSHSYTGNPLACAAALACLALFRDEDVLGRNQALSAQMGTAADALRDHPNVAEVRQRGMIVAFDDASKILIVTGLIQILWGLVTGIPMGNLRMAGREVPRYLTLVHMGGLMQGPLLMGLVFAVQLSKLPAGWEVTAAATISVASVLLVLKDTLNWRMGVQDEFAERPMNFYLGVALGPLYLIGTLILVVGALASLV